VTSLDTAAGRALAPTRHRAMLPIVFAGAIGTNIEWCDFLIYGTAAALVFSGPFFSNFDPLTGTLAGLGSYVVGFFARPFGGLLFGHFAWATHPTFRTWPAEKTNRGRER
jgi:hypothetical protein